MTDVVQFVRCLNMTVDLSRIFAVSEPEIRSQGRYHHEIVLRIKMQGDPELWEVTWPIEEKYLLEAPDPEDMDHWYMLLLMHDDHEYRADRADKRDNWESSLAMIEYRKLLVEFLRAWGEVRMVSHALRFA